MNLLVFNDKLLNKQLRVLLLFYLCIISFCEKRSTQAMLFCVCFLCSMQHVPGFITQAEHLKAKGVDEILLISGRLLAYLCFCIYIPKQLFSFKKNPLAIS